MRAERSTRTAYVGIDCSTAECGNWAESSWAFGALDRLAPSSTTRGTGRTELVRRGIADGTEISGKRPGVGPNFAATIPVYVHVITDGDEGRVPEEAIDEQITVLNMTFGGFRGGANTGFSFELVNLDYTDNAEWFGYDGSTDLATEIEMKAALKQGDATALNIYVNSGNGYLGYAYYPSIVTSQRYRVLDGVVVHYGTLPGLHRGLRPRLHGDARGRSLARAGPHVRAGLHRPRRLRGRHAGDARADERLSRRARTPARRRTIPGSIRSTTTWTTRTTPATSSSRRVRRSERRRSTCTGGSSTATTARRA